MINSQAKWGDAPLALQDFIQSNKQKLSANAVIHIKRRRKLKVKKKLT